MLLLSLKDGPISKNKCPADGPNILTWNKQKREGKLGKKKTVKLALQLNNKAAGFNLVAHNYDLDGSSN